MPLLLNLRHLGANNIQLEGELPVAELDIATQDEVIQVAGPLQYALEVQKLEDGLLVQGKLNLCLKCQCVRCLKAFKYDLELSHWTSHLPLQGEDAIQVVNDCVDLTPWVREDILLEFPQHPLCKRDCSGLRTGCAGTTKTSSIGLTEEGSPAWKELNKLRF